MELSGTPDKSNKIELFKFRISNLQLRFFALLRVCFKLMMTGRGVVLYTPKVCLQIGMNTLILFRIVLLTSSRHVFCRNFGLVTSAACKHSKTFQTSLRIERICSQKESQLLENSKAYSMRTHPCMYSGTIFSRNSFPPYFLG